MTAYNANVNTTMRRVPPGRHVFVARDPSASAGNESSLGSLDAPPPANLHGYAEWDFSGVPDPVMFRRFLDATDYWFGCSDDSSTGSYDPARECYVVIANDPANATGAAGAGDGEVTPAPGIAPRLAAGPSTPAGADADAQLAQARELEAKLAEEYRTVRLLRASMAGEASARGKRVRELGRQARDRINTDNPDTPPRASQKLVATATLLRAMPAPSTPEARNLQREVQALIEQAAVQQAESSASRIRQQGEARGDGAAQGGEPSVHAGEAARRPANSGRAAAKERLLDTRRALDGDARNVINSHRTSRADARAAVGYDPRWGGRYDSDEDRSPMPEPLGTRVFSREIRAVAFPQRFRQPSTIVKYNGETDPRVWLNDYRLACQLGGATSDEVIIRNLPLHLGDAARTWLEHLPASQIHNWDDLVRTFVGNFQGTYVRP
jgi:murein DD-endopeptidase MepM/ murein hydrolase activator NlpD